MWTGIIGGNDKRGELAKWRYTGRTRWNNGEAMKETIKRTGFRCCGRVSNSGGGTQSAALEVEEPRKVRRQGRGERRKEMPVYSDEDEKTAPRSEENRKGKGNGGGTDKERRHIYGNLQRR